MANIASVLKEEITRLARKEVRNETEGLKKTSSQYRSEIANLKRQVATLERRLKHLEKVAANTVEVKTYPEASNKTRFTVKGFKSLRQRLGLTAEVIGKLLGVSAQTIYNWEAGNSSPREQQLVRIVKLRGLGKKEVAAILLQLTA